MKRKWRAAIVGCMLLVIAILPIIGRTVALTKLERLLEGRSVAIDSAQIVGRSGRLDLSTEDSRVNLAVLLRSATTRGSDSFSVAESTTLSLTFGFLQSTSITLYITSDQQLVVSVPSSVWDGLLSFSDQKLMRLEASAGAVGARVIETFVGAKKGA